MHPQLRKRLIFLGNDMSDFSNELWKVFDKLTAIMDRMKEELKRNDDLAMKKCLRALVSSQGQLLKAICAFDPSYKIPLEAGETWEHFLAENYLVKEIPSEHIFPKFGLGECIVDVVAKIGGESVIIEAETVSGKSVEKARKIKTILTDLVSEKLKILEPSLTFSEIKEHLKSGKPLRLIFVTTRKPSTLTLQDIKKEENSLINLEVYYVNRIPPFEISSNLLEKIQI
jgi:hypothetical protein